LSIDELFADPDDVERDALFASCRRLQNGDTDCIYPHNELTTRLVCAHAANPGGFDWKAVNVRAVEYERGIQQRDLVANRQLSAKQRTFQLQAGKDYNKIFSAELREELEAVFAAHNAAPPPTFREAATRARSATPNLVIAIGKLLYDRAAVTNADEAT